MLNVIFCFRVVRRGIVGGVSTAIPTPKYDPSQTQEIKLSKLKKDFNESEIRKEISVLEDKKSKLESKRNKLEFVPSFNRLVVVSIHHYVVVINNSLSISHLRSSLVTTLSINASTHTLLNNHRKELSQKQDKYDQM